MIKAVFSLVHANKHQQAGHRNTNSCPYCSSCLCLSGHDGVALGRWPCLCFPVVWRLVQKVRGGKTPVAFGRECVGERGRRAITFVCRFVHRFLVCFCIHTDVRFACCVLHVCVCGYSLRLIVVSAFSSSPSLLRPCFLPNLLTSICLCL